MIFHSINIPKETSVLRVVVFCRAITTEACRSRQLLMKYCLLITGVSIF